jgi:uncharacterized protein
VLSLLLGSFPGIFVGSWLSARVPDVALRYVLGGVLIVVGTRLALNITGHLRPDLAAFGIHAR